MTSSDTCDVVCRLRVCPAKPLTWMTSWTDAGSTANGTMETKGEPSAFNVPRAATRWVWSSVRKAIVRRGSWVIIMKLDRYDQHILDVLQQDGRINNQDLADRIGLSPSPCLRRVRALEESGLITGYRALLDAQKLGLTLMALIHISMDVHTPERFANFEAAVSVLPEVLECLLITGQEADYQLKVMVRDMDHYQSLLLNQLTRIAGVTGVHSSFVLRRVPGSLYGLGPGISAFSGIACTHRLARSA
jgi:Lrp/AsnC family leucine-responsive transcriptional regulator